MTRAPKLKVSPRAPSRLATKAKLLKDGHLSEDSIQQTVMQFIAKHPILKNTTIHIPNEGARTITYARRLKAMGMRAGALDLFIALPRHGFHGAWFELKSHNGVLSENQRQFICDMIDQGYYTYVCRSLDEALRVIKWYAEGKEECSTRIS